MTLKNHDTCLAGCFKEGYLSAKVKLCIELIIK